MIPVLSLYMVSLLINDGINNIYPKQTSTIDKIHYYLKRNYKSFLSRLLKQTNILNERGIFEFIPYTSLCYAGQI